MKNRTPLQLIDILPSVCGVVTLTGLLLVVSKADIQLGATVVLLGEPATFLVATTSFVSAVGRRQVRTIHALNAGWLALTIGLFAWAMFSYAAHPLIFTF
jgi:hypothetical protein